MDLKRPLGDPQRERDPPMLTASASPVDLTLYQEEEEAMDYVTRLAAGMHLVEPRHVLCADHVMEDWDPELVGGEGRGLGWDLGTCFIRLYCWQLLVSMGGKHSAASFDRSRVQKAVGPWSVPTLYPLGAPPHSPGLQIERLLSHMRPDGEGSCYRIDLMTRSYPQVGVGVMARFHPRCV